VGPLVRTAQGDQIQLQRGEKFGKEKTPDEATKISKEGKKRANCKLGLQEGASLVVKKKQKRSPEGGRGGAQWRHQQANGRIERKK